MWIAGVRDHAEKKIETADPESAAAWRLDELAASLPFPVRLADLRKRDNLSLFLLSWHRRGLRDLTFPVPGVYYDISLLFRKKQMFNYQESTVSWQKRQKKPRLSKP